MTDAFTPATGWDQAGRALSRGQTEVYRVHPRGRWDRGKTGVRPGIKGLGQEGQLPFFVFRRHPKVQAWPNSVYLLNLFTCKIHQCPHAVLLLTLLSEEGMRVGEAVLGGGVAQVSGVCRSDREGVRSGRECTGERGRACRSEGRLCRERGRACGRGKVVQVGEGGCAGCAQGSRGSPLNYRSRDVQTGRGELKGSPGFRDNQKHKTLGRAGDAG